MKLFTLKNIALEKIITLKKYVLAVLAILLMKSGFAQQDSLLPVYQRFPEIPPFTITKLPDSTKFAKADLQKKKATIIMVFSPDCEHCQHATEDMLKHIDLFKDVQIVMATPLEYRFIVPFYRIYNLANHPNITVGRDPNYFFGTFFQITNYPTIVLYDKKGNFKERFEGSVSFEKIASYL